MRVLGFAHALGAASKLRQSTCMTRINFEQARAAHRALEQFFAAHPKGRLEADALVDVQTLCRQAENAVDHVQCRRAIRSIENYSELLMSREPAQRGADFVRLRVQNALASFRSQLKAIEAAEAAVGV
jgi:hypothetical protein